MATASHEHIPDLSASLSDPHHFAPLSDLWGLPHQNGASSAATNHHGASHAAAHAGHAAGPSGALSGSAGTPGPGSRGPSAASEQSGPGADDLALDLARDSFRGPLMSSASSSSALGDGEETALTATSSPDPHAVGQPAQTALWSTQTPLMGLNPSVSPQFRGPAPGQGSASVPGVKLGPVGNQYSQGIWGPRKGLAFANKPQFFNNGSTPASATSPAPPNVGPVPTGAQLSASAPPSAGSAPGLYKTPWALDPPSGPGASAANSSSPQGASVPGAMRVPMPPPVAGGVPGGMPQVGVMTSQVGQVGSVPVQTGFYAMHGPAPMPGSLPTMSPMHKIPTPPNGSPSPPAVHGHPGRMYPHAEGAPHHAGMHGHPGAHGARLSPDHTGQPRGMHQHDAVANGQFQQPLQAAPQQVHAQPAQHPHHAQTQPHHHHHQQRLPKKNGRPSTNTELYKTELCASYMSTGGNCPYGEKCQFAHGHDELKSVDRPPKWRSKPCQNWVKTGTCSYNERCCFRHDVHMGQ